MHNAKVSFQVNNLFNKTDIFGLAGYTAQNGTSLYWTLPGRSYQLSLSVGF
jgi:iron complex outermembrane receptor protein